MNEKKEIAKCNGGIKLASFYLKKFNKLIEKLREFDPTKPPFTASAGEIDDTNFTNIVKGIVGLTDTANLFSNAVTDVEPTDASNDDKLRAGKVVRGQVILRIPVGYDTILKNNINIHRHPKTSSNGAPKGLQQGLKDTNFSNEEYILEPYLTVYCENVPYFEEQGHPNTRDLIAKIPQNGVGGPKPKYITSIELQSGPYTYDSKLDASTYEPEYTQQIMDGGARKSRKQYTYVRKNSMKNKRARGRTGSKRRQRNVQRTQMRKNRYRLRK